MSKDDQPEEDLSPEEVHRLVLGGGTRLSRPVTAWSPTIYLQANYRFRNYVETWVYPEEEE